ncbi:hypothetical protein CDD83_551 [Cordyceps sp. RAO-2017]|nr:hypothetical protein CDD83_551 [Cordyceps sp. RAO-2017]
MPLPSPGSPAALSLLLAQMPSAPSVPRADEALQSLVPSILRQPNYSPTSTIPSQLRVMNTLEHHASQQLPSLGISAGQVLEKDIDEDHSAGTGSQYPTDPLPEAEISDSLESSSQGGSNLAPGDCEISSNTQKCRPDVYHDNHEDHVGSAHIDMPNCPSPATGRKTVGKENGQVIDTSEAVQKSSRKRRKRIHVFPDAKRRRSSRNISSHPTSANLATQKGKSTPARSMPNPPAPLKMSEGGSGKTSTAIFEEWPLQNVIFKRVVIDGVATFQLQFEWPCYPKHSRGSTFTDNTRHITTTRATGGQAGRAYGTSARFTPEEDHLLTKLKMGQEKLSWVEIHRRFNDKFPRRSRGSLQVHYCTKLRHTE